MKKGLFALALGTFTLGMTEFIIEGIITDVAHNMNVSIPEAGHLISIYALGVCAGAFSLILMHKYRPKKILMFLASIITIGAIIASVAPTYWLLLCARFIQGLPHGAYFGTATIVAVKMAKEGKATKLSNDFNALVRAASQYNSVREKVADPTRLGIDSMYQFKSIKLCADIQKTLIDSLVQRGESKQP